MRKRKLNQADKELRALASVMEDLPIDVQLLILYERACIASMSAKDHALVSPERSAALDAAVSHLEAWYLKGRGRNGGWKRTGRTAAAEVHRMASDGDLRTVINERQQKLRRIIPSSYWPNTKSVGGGGGCVVSGTSIDTPIGPRRIEDVRLGDVVRSVRPDENPESVYGTITGIVTSRVASCVQVNRKLTATLDQKIRSAAGWVRVGDLEVGDKVIDRHGALVQVENLDHIKGYFEIFYLTIDGVDHTYVADGLLCHNAKYLF